MKYSQTKPWTWTDTSVQSKQQKRDMRFGTWNIWSLYRAGSFTAAAREFAGYKLHVVSVQDVRWDREGTVGAGDYNFSMEKVMRMINWKQDSLYITE